MTDAAKHAVRGRGRRSARWRFGFRIVAISLSLSLFAVAELALALAGWGEADASDDPFVGFAAVRPLFELTADRRYFQTSPVRRRFFREDSFTAVKPDGEFRIFVLGGSTVQGRPFSIETSFPAYLQVALETCDSEHSWKVVNCGGVSYASYRLVPVLQECLAYKPDLFIFCGGHNEFLEDVSYASVRATPSLVRQTFSLLNESRIFRVVRHGVLKISGESAENLARNSSESSGSRPLLPEDVDTLLDHDGGLAAYHRNNEHAAMVATHFQNNLTRMAQLSEFSGVPLMMIMPPSNFSDCPPFKSEFSPSVPDDQRRRVMDSLHEASELSSRRIDDAIRMAVSAVEIDPGFALSWYELGQLQISARRFEDAEASFRRARDEDICPLRITTPLETAMRNVVKEFRLPYINAHEILETKCPNGIIGDNVLVDHVHPSFRSHEDIAVAIADWMISAGLTHAKTSEWQDVTHAKCQSRLQTLDNLYFLRGRRALENLRLWAAGRSGGPPLNP